MQNSFDTSFIPQQPLLKVEGTMRRREAINLALVLALVVFFVTLVLAGGTFFYHREAVAMVHTRALELEDAEKLLNTDEIAHYKSIDTRITTAKQLLQEHDVFTILLSFLEEGTARNVGLTSLGYSKDQKDLELSILAQAPSYEAVYFQGETWRGIKPLVTSVDISDISLAEDSGIVSFGAKIVVNPELIKYARILANQARARATEAQQAAQSTVTAPPAETLAPGALPPTVNPSGPPVLVTPTP